MKVKSLKMISLVTKTQICKEIHQTHNLKISLIYFYMMCAMLVQNPLKIVYLTNYIMYATIITLFDVVLLTVYG